MKFLERLASWYMKRSLENPAVPMSQAIDMLLDAFGSGTNPSGEIVNGRTALRMTAVYACVRVIAETAGSLPIGVYRERDDGTRERDRRHHVDAVLHNPNPVQTGQVWAEQAIKSHLLYGNTYAKLVRNMAGRVLEIWPMHPDRTRPFLRDRKLFYETIEDDGRPLYLDPNEVLHVPLLPDPATVAGEPPPACARTAIGIGLAAEKHAAKHFAEGALGPMAIEAGDRWDDSTFNHIRAQFIEARKKFKGVFILEGDTKAHELKQDLAVFLDMRRFQVLEVCRVYGVPPFMVGESEKGAPKSSVQEQEREFANHTLRPLTKRHEAEFDRKLFRASDPRIVRFDMGELLSADTRTTWWTYSIARQMGIMSLNEIRQKLGMPGIGAAGDQYLKPVNLEVVSRSLERLLQDAMDRVTGELEDDERRQLLEASDDGVDSLGDRADRFFEDRIDQVSAGLADAGERFARSKLVPLGIPVNIAEFREYCRRVAASHRDRAVEALRSDALGWIAGGRVEYDPGDAMAAIIGGTGHANESESAGA